MFQSEIKWTNVSVKKLTSSDDPINVVLDKVREVIINASDMGFTGPPYDPFKIANFMGVKILPKHDVSDAILISIPDGKFLIEYNPNHSKSRIRFSIAHELTHLLFPDCDKEIRNRDLQKNYSRDNWQLEMLCNIGASEFLMPIGSFPDLKKEEITIGNYINLRNRYNVSTEALFLRAVKLTKEPCLIFCATRINPNDINGEYGIDYLIGSKRWSLKLPKNIKLPKLSIVNRCTAVGYTLIDDEIWDKKLGEFHIECVGIPAYPNHRYPRVIGIVTKTTKKNKKINSINYLMGDATHPKVGGNYIVAHIINDKALRWGGRGFAKFLKAKFPTSEKQYLNWRKQFPLEFMLGNNHIAEINEKIDVVSMISQKGYGASKRPRIRYTALKLCLQKLASNALGLTQK